MPYPPLNQPLVIEQVPGEPIYYSIGSPGIPDRQNEGNTSNAGFVVTADGVVVFDALGTPSLGWNLLEAIRKVTSAPVRYNVVSHYHADHIYGLQAFKDHTGASSLRRSAPPNTAKTRKPPASAPIKGSISGARRWRRRTNLGKGDESMAQRRALTLMQARFVAGVISGKHK